MDLFGEEEVIEKEETFEADESFEEFFHHPRQMEHLLGHENAQEELLNAFKCGRMPHGIILNGVRGIGKATLAYRFARFLLKNPPHNPNQNSMFDIEPVNLDQSSLHIDRADPIFSRVASGGHPDLLTLERAYDATKNRTAESLAVAELRKVEPFLRMTSSNGGWRVVIIDDADTMNRNAQNALLKILEEPPKNTIIMLITHRLGALIPTIRSRTRLINIDIITNDVMNELLVKKGYSVDSNQLEIISAMANGSFGQACDLIEQGGLESFATITSILNDMPNIDWRLVHHHADQCARAGQDQLYKNMSHTLIWIYKTLVFAKARGHALKPYSLNEAPLSTILAKSSLAQLLKICENLTDHFEMTNRGNLDKKQAILGAFQIISA
ncbi:MAG: DNA polymerase III subunit delta' [Bdellovibrionales bacterium]